MKIPYIVFAISMGVLPPAADTAYASCGSAFCMVNTNWNAQGVWTEPGMRFDLRYEYINQDQPMAGEDRITVGQVRRHHDEVKTINRSWLATFDYSFNKTWGAAVTVPVSDRDHFHVHNHHGATLPETWEFTELGDVRVLGRYQLQSEDLNALEFNFFGLNFGLKLPTGKIDVRNLEGDRAERSLQPGTGATDLLMGGFYRQMPADSDWSWFAQTLLQLPLNSREDYRPGKRLSVDLGYRYEASDKLGLMLQLNALVRDRDAGKQAEPEDTGGRALFISPGLSYSLTKDVQIYSFVQRPIYQYVNSVQLTARWSGVIGVSTRF